MHAIYPPPWHFCPALRTGQTARLLVQSYVATLSLASEFSGSSGLAVGGVVLLRFLPSLLLAPVTGVVADRCVEAAAACCCCEGMQEAGSSFMSCT
jgi:hypothetical protein